MNDTGFNCERCGETFFIGGTAFVMIGRDDIHCHSCRNEIIIKNENNDSSMKDNPTADYIYSGEWKWENLSRGSWAKIQFIDGGNYRRV